MGKLVYPDGVTVIEGQFDDDPSVQVEVTMRKGEHVMYKGQMVNHELEGEGTVYDWKDGTPKYTGQWSQSKQHGHGTYYYEDVSKYVGQWRHGKRHGEGALTELGEVCYKGQWKHDKFDGEGERRYIESVTSVQLENQNGVAVYAGQWKQGKCEGAGRITFPDGETYVGQWQDNMRHGQGTNVGARSGVDYSGEWVHGKPAACQSPQQQRNAKRNRKKREARKRIAAARRSAGGGASK
jgi:hypothetical protein